MEMNRISDELLREAVKQACEREGTYYEEFTKDAKHHFSIRHRIRMRRLYRKMKRKKAEEPVDRYKVYTYPMTEDDDDRRQFVSTRVPRLRPRLFLIVVLLMVGMSMTVFAIEPIREGIYQLIERCFSDHTDISFEKVQSEIKGQEEEIKEFKPQKLEYVPEGYVLENEEKLDGEYFCNYIDKKERYFNYSQTNISKFELVSITSDGTRAEKIKVNKKNGYWIEDVDGWNTLLYVHNGYVYSVAGYMKIQNLVNIIEKNKKI